MNYQPHTDLLSSFKGIDLEELDAVSLLDRMEFKYLVPITQLTDLLARMRDDYMILEIEEQRTFAYVTDYYDTPEFALYKAHHNGVAKRVKVRKRMYEHSGECYVEVKQKLPNGHTLKKRHRTMGMANELSLSEQKYVGSVVPLPTPEYKLTNTFSRMTFADRQLTERVTIDTNIAMYTLAASKELKGLALVEIKRAMPGMEGFNRVMKAAGIRSTPFSKYALGVALLFPGIKSNNFKPQLLKLRRYGAY